ncbi:LAGLIDADG family homing endonuclease [Belnapia moabensis]|uniref:LAGLIDADG family homing endonuclease n=1 Tax=Belnapia moabensis TaxID=365533 RepID=UPI0012EDBB62|nr:LAGLIDADG family homing endonuclease [Belnapia moabensis]
MQGITGGLTLDQILPCPLSTSPSGIIRVADVRVGHEVFGAAGRVVPVVAIADFSEAKLARYRLDTGEEVRTAFDQPIPTMTAEERKLSAKRSDEYRARRRAARPSRAKAVSKKPGVSLKVTELNRQRQHAYLDPILPSPRLPAAIMASLLHSDGRELNHSVPVSVGVELPEATLPIEPYHFGAWLGDGYSAAGKIGMAQSDFELLFPYLPEPASKVVDPRPAYRRPFLICRWDGMTTALRELGVLKNKHVPAIYLRSSIAQRIALLQGLLDTDGTCNSRGQIEFSVTSQQLIEGVLDLVAGLGIKVELRQGPAKLYGRTVGTRGRLKFMAPFPAFRLPRKAERQKLKGFRPTTLRRYIASAVEDEPAPVRAFAIGSADGVFLVGRSLIAVHGCPRLEAVAVERVPQTDAPSTWLFTPLGQWLSGRRTN